MGTGRISSKGMPQATGVSGYIFWMSHIMHLLPLLCSYTWAPAEFFQGGCHMLLVWVGNGYAIQMARILYTCNIKRLRDCDNGQSSAIHLTLKPVILLCSRLCVWYIFGVHHRKTKQSALDSKLKLCVMYDLKHIWDARACTVRQCVIAAATPRSNYTISDKILSSASIRHCCRHANNMSKRRDPTTPLATKYCHLPQQSMYARTFC